MKNFELKIDSNGEVIVTVDSELLTIHQSKELLRRLRLIAGEHDKNITINFESVLSIDSAIIAMLVEFNNVLKDSGRMLTLTNLCPFVRKVFEMLHMAKFFNIR
jgi:anti-anti-sigma factor